MHVYPYRRGLPWGEKVLESGMPFFMLLMLTQRAFPTIVDPVARCLLWRWRLLFLQRLESGMLMAGVLLRAMISAIVYCTVLYCTILYYTILYYTILYYTILYYTILYYTILYYTML